MLTKLQIAFCVLAGLGLVVFAAGMFAAKKDGETRALNAAKMPTWVSPVALGSVGLTLASCLGVMVTLALDREKPPKSEAETEEEGEGEETGESELLPVDEPLPEGEGPAADGLTTVDQAETETIEGASAVEDTPMEFTEPGTAETVEFSTLPAEELDHPPEE